MFAAGNSSRLFFLNTVGFTYEPILQLTQGLRNSRHGNFRCRMRSDWCSLPDVALWQEVPDEDGPLRNRDSYCGYGRSS